jgi:hypothetical protein
MSEKRGSTLEAAHDDPSAATGDFRRERRAQSRIPTSLRAIESRDGQDRLVRVTDVSIAGAFIVTKSLTDVPPVGTALRMKLRMPVGFWISVTVVVRWRRSSDTDPGYGVEFEQLAEHDAFFLRGHLNDPNAGRATLEAELAVKYRVDRDGRALVISIAGHLNDADGDQLALEIVRRRRLSEGGALCVYVNASRFAASSRGALERLTNGLRALADLPQLTGILVEGTSVGRMQVRRLVRDAGLSEALICFENEREASAAWSHLYTMQRAESDVDER